MITKEKHRLLLKERKIIASCNDAYNYSCNQSIFPILNSNEDMIAFLKRVSHEHNTFFHHTTVDGLAYILKTERWKFSSARKTNDLHEFTLKGNPNEWKYIYSCSLSHGDGDNIGMWKMYGDKRYSVCLKLSRHLIEKWIQFLNERKEYYCNLKGFARLVPRFQEASLHDIAYVHGYQSPHDSIVCWGNIINPIRWKENISSEVNLTGYIKNSAWEYEKETRIMINLPKINDMNNPLPDTPDEIYVDLYDDMVNDIEEITISPFAAKRDELLDRLHFLLGSFSLKRAIKDKFTESYFSGKIQGSNLT